MVVILFMYVRPCNPVVTSSSLINDILTSKTTLNNYTYLPSATLIAPLCLVSSRKKNKRKFPDGLHTPSTSVYFRLIACLSYRLFTFCFVLFSIFPVKLSSHLLHELTQPTFIYQLNIFPTHTHTHTHTHTLRKKRKKIQPLSKAIVGNFYHLLR